MSRKWHRSKAWDDRYIPRWAFPVKFVLRAFSSIWLAVLLLSLVALYGVLASTPLGLMLTGVTYGVYALTLLGVVAVVAGFGVLCLRAIVPPDLSGLRFTLTLLGLIGFTVLGAAIWHQQVWPRLVYDPATGTGLMLFAETAERYSAVTVRRLPGVEMSELEFYSWWPMHMLLLLFVVNMIVTTVRRIEFTFKNIGVLTVHSGIVVITLGSILYTHAKLEGDMILWAGSPGPDGIPREGSPQRFFFDNTHVALHLRWDDPDSAGDGRWFSRPLRGVPRYNEYNLGASIGQTAMESGAQVLPWEEYPERTLDIAVPDDERGRHDPSVRFRIVGYAPYAETLTDWRRADRDLKAGIGVGETSNPLRIVQFLSALPSEGRPDGEERPAFVFDFLPEIPSQRLAKIGDAAAIEYTNRMPEERWADLTEELPDGTMHALVVEVPGENGEVYRGVYPVRGRQPIEVGQTGYRLVVEGLDPEPELAIVTEGYEGGESSVARVLVEAPPAEGEEAGESYTRWVYHRFPEISQDILDEALEDGRPGRRDADPGIRIGYIDASRLQVYLDDRPDGGVRAAIREPGGALRVVERLGEDGRLADIVDRISLRVIERWDHAESFERPSPVPGHERDPDRIGMHDEAMLAVEVTVDPEKGGYTPDGELWQRVVWLPFSRYLDPVFRQERTMQLPDGRELSLAFGRRYHQLGGFALQLVEFEMISYEHRGAPRDFRSMVRVIPSDDPSRSRIKEASLNSPMMAPYSWDPERSFWENVAWRLVAGLNPGQFKFSQAMWDQGNWEQTQAMADRGELPRPYAQWTILGVGNNPGIHVIAFGSVMVGVGIPWAFYLKPWLVRREKRRIQEALAESGGRGPRSGESGGVGRGVAGAMGPSTV